jgi:hypothetical protein
LVTGSADAEAAGKRCKPSPRFGRWKGRHATCGTEKAGVDSAVKCHAPRLPAGVSHIRVDRAECESNLSWILSGQAVLVA